MFGAFRRQKEETELLKECCLCLLHVVDRVLTFYNWEWMQE